MNVWNAVKASHEKVHPGIEHDKLREQDVMQVGCDAGAMCSYMDMSGLKAWPQSG